MVGTMAYSKHKAIGSKCTGYCWC